MAAEQGILQEFKILISQKKSKLNALLSIAMSQKDMIEQDHVEELRRSMEQRLSLSETIDKLDVQCLRLKRELRSLTGESSNAISEAESGLMQTILQIQSIDQVNADGLRSKIGEYQKSIKQLRLSNKSREIYTQAYDKFDGVFFDIKK